MIAQAIGFDPNGFMSGILKILLWLITGFTGRKFRRAT